MWLHSQLQISYIGTCWDWENIQQYNDKHELNDEEKEMISKYFFYFIGGAFDQNPFVCALSEILFKACLKN